MKSLAHLLVFLIALLALNACAARNVAVRLSQPLRNTLPSSNRLQRPVFLRSSSPVLPTTKAPGQPIQTGHNTFSLQREQAQEIAVFMNFISAYNGGQVEEALAFLSDDVGVSDCDFHDGKVVTFSGKSEAKEWLQNRISEHDHLEVKRIFNENPESSGEHTIGVEYARRANLTLEQLGFVEGIVPEVASKVIFSVEPTLISRFANGPYGGDARLCRPENYS